MFRRNVGALEAKLTFEVMGELLDPSAGHLVEDVAFDSILDARIEAVFHNMLVVHWSDPLVEVLFDKPTWHNRGWDEHVALMRTRVAEQGYYDTRQNTISPFYADVLFVAIAEPPTNTNLAYLFHRLTSPELYRLGVRRMRVVIESPTTGSSGTFIGDVRETPDYPEPR